ncbi:aromatic prenyltransferase [Penicillium canariense]|uniref:Aromatic prenyltransferase n=1 Tax=Penicillium canariense TaxID=189055 RepID=A0A9W9IGV3_9EURO|nr:aromatic prenyltransferase [Penicillium canariense]KAJ5176142.1 aromatic prenyltransferase [Penicillium canariense]
MPYKAPKISQGRRRIAVSRGCRAQPTAPEAEVKAPRDLDTSDSEARLAEHRGLENGKGMHAYISYQCSQKGELDIKKARYVEARYVDI